MTQLYAMIKSSSKHYGQRHYHVDKNEKPVPFPVTIDEAEDETNFGAVVGGVGGNYRFEEVNLYVRHMGKFKRINA